MTLFVLSIFLQYFFFLTETTLEGEPVSETMKATGEAVEFIDTIRQCKWLQENHEKRKAPRSYST